MSKITDKLIFDFIKFHYRPYDTHKEFGRGFSAYRVGNFCNPHEATVSPLRRGTGGSRLRCTLRKRPPAETAQALYVMCRAPSRGLLVERSVTANG